jgi:hypothetical protein
MNEQHFENGYALIIGVQNDIQSVNDAKKLYEILTDITKAGYPTSNVQLITETGATKEGILTALDELNKKVKDNPTATVIIYYSGHGGQFLEEGTNNYYLIPYNFDYDNLTDTALSRQEFSERVNTINSKVQKMMIVFDCCHAEGIKDGAKKLVSRKEFKASNLSLDDSLAVGRGYISIASCSENEKSYVDKQSAYGIFTNCLIEALEGENSTNDAAYITYNRITEYLSREVVKRTLEQYKQSQTPVVNIVGATVFNVCKNRKFKPPSPKVFIISDPKDNAFLVKLKEELQVLVQQKLIEQWDIEDVPPFAIVEKALEEKLEKAQYVLGLISTNFLNSPICEKLHLKTLRQSKPFTPILLKNCGYKYIPAFKGLNLLPRKEGITLALDVWGYEVSNAYEQIRDELFNMTQPKEEN